MRRRRLSLPTWSSTRTSRLSKLEHDILSSASLTVSSLLPSRRLDTGGGRGDDPDPTRDGDGTPSLLPEEPTPAAEWGTTAAPPTAGGPPVPTPAPASGGTLGSGGPAAMAGIFQSGWAVACSGDGHRLADSGASVIPAAPAAVVRGVVATAAAPGRDSAVVSALAVPAATAGAATVRFTAAAAPRLLARGGRGCCIDDFLPPGGAGGGLHCARAASTVSRTRAWASTRSLAFRRRSRGLTNPSSLPLEETGATLAGGLAAAGRVLGLTWITRRQEGKKSGGGEGGGEQEKTNK